jgi:hypothetical protein
MRENINKKEFTRNIPPHIKTGSRPKHKEYKPNYSVYNDYSRRNFVKPIVITIISVAMGLGGFLLLYLNSRPLNIDKLWNITALVSSIIIAIAWIASVLPHGFFSHYELRIKFGGILGVPFIIYLALMITSAFLSAILEAKAGISKTVSFTIICASYLGASIIALLLAIFVRGYK